VERRVEVEMSQIINVKDLSEEEVKLVGDFIEFLKARKEGKKEKRESEGIAFASWHLEVKGKLRREEIY
jgi:hypothetical protein